MRIAGLATLVCVVGCAPLLTQPSVGDMSKMMAQSQALMAQAEVARAAAEVNCEPVRKQDPGFEEERVIGQELAITLCARVGHFYVDGATEKDPKKLIEALASQTPVALPESGKNVVSAHVAVVGKNLARYSGRPDLPWVFGVLDSQSPQAFSTPGGYVFVTTALLKKMTNEAQLAGVLAHEISHVVHKHVLRTYVEARFKQCVAARYAAHLIETGTQNKAVSTEVARYARSFDTPSDRSKADPGFTQFIMQVMMMLVQSGNEKDVEFQTDRAALELVSFAGYDALEYEKFLTGWAQASHPASLDRALKLEALRKGELSDFVHGTAKPTLGQVFAPLGQ